MALHHGTIRRFIDGTFFSLTRFSPSGLGTLEH
ncbi:hypothetical protein MTR67_026165 [Solanum verrucosum]|uniref:Uncharacterized protein n=1 Tax=Solanum verrucosum TaxID=315347 RepID=A0AAF0R1S6_SOLVR|nr:hypothetical protein MTR67_026165 [Solanum verrucosum]